MRFLWWLAFILLIWSPSALGAPLAAGDPALDRTTPRRTYAGFHAACAAGDYDHAAKYLDLRAARHESDGPMLAGELCYVIGHQTTVDADTLPDVPEGADVTLASLVVDEETLPIVLGRARFSDGASRWVFSRGTVAEIPELTHAFGSRGLEERMPKFLRGPQVLELAPWQWIGFAVVLLAALALGRLVSWLVLAVARPLARRTKGDLDDRLVEVSARPFTVFLAVAFFRVGTRWLALTPDAVRQSSRLLTMLGVLAVAWLMMRMLRATAEWLEHRASEHQEVDSRGLRTRISVLHRVGSFAVAVIAGAAILMQFEIVRGVGTSLLASAGIAGLAVGLAAQKSLGAIVAGIQILLAQPMRIGDIVVIESQQGVVEEIHLTYVVVRLMDDRRLITPIQRFLDQSFENWTKLGSALRGYVVFTVDFATPLDRVRAELERLCKASPRWDGRNCVLEVTDAIDRGLTLRATVSAKDADALWELRCTLREALVRFVCDLEGGRHVARSRTEVFAPTTKPTA